MRAVCLGKELRPVIGIIFCRDLPRYFSNSFVKLASVFSEPGVDALGFDAKYLYDRNVSDMEFLIEH